MSLHITDGEAIHALHYNRVSKRQDGWGVYDLSAGNCNVVINTGNLGVGTGTLTVRPGDAVLGGTDAVITEQIVNIPQADTAPRKDVVVLNPDGTAGRVAGTPEPKQPTSRELTRSERPAPPDLSTVNAVPLAVICVPEGATAITANEIIDVRPPALTGGSGGGTTASVSGRYPETGTITADGTTTTFSWTVSSPATLSMALVDAATPAGSGDFDVTVDDAANTISVTYATAPTGELAWYWAANVSITEVDTVTHGAASHDPSVADQADLDAHTTNTSNPHTTTAEQARLAGDTLEGTLRSVLGADDYRVLVDGSGGTVTDPFTLRFEDRDLRFFAGGVGGIGSAVHVAHDSGDMTLGGGITAQGSGHITGDLTVDGNIAGVADQTDLATKADKDGAGTGTLANYAEIDTDGLDVTGWNWVDVTNHGVPTHNIDTATLQNVTARTDYPDYASCVGPINNLFAQYGEETVFIFPAGDYWVPWDEIIHPSGISRDLAIVCRSGSRFVHEPFTQDTTLASGAAADKWLKLFGDTVTVPIENLHLSGMTVNIEADECGRGIQATTSGVSSIEDLTIVGQNDALASGDRPLTPRVPDEHGVLHIDRYQATDGALWDTTLNMADPNDSSLRIQGIFVGEGADTKGTVIIRDCELAGWTSHAIYASKTDGPVRVIRPRLRNNRGVGVRVGATGSTVENPRILIDNTTGQVADYDSIRPIRVEGTGQTGGGENITIRNPEIILRSVPTAITQYAFEIDPTIRSATVEGGYVYTDNPQQLTRLDAATVPNDGIVIEDLTFKRDSPPASDSLTSVAAINLYREKVKLRDVTVRTQQGDLTKSRGVLLRSNYCVIDGGTFYADQGGLMLGGSENLIQNNVHINSNGDGIEYISGSDNRMQGLSKSLIQEAGKSVQAGGRSRWNGVIGAGPLGGIDLSTTHGKEIGDLAISNGSGGNLAFPDGTMARWRGSSWVRVDGQETITPP